MTRIDDAQRPFFPRGAVALPAEIGEKRHGHRGPEEGVSGRQFGSVPVVNFNYKNSGAKTFAPDPAAPDHPSLETLNYEFALGLGNRGPCQVL